MVHLKSKVFGRSGKAVLACLLAVALAPCFPGSASAELTAGSVEPMSVTYLPGVTEPMTHGSYWSAKQADPTALLADRAKINALNQAGVDADGTRLQPLKEAAERFYTAEEKADLKADAAAQLSELVGKVYDLDGHALTSDDVDAILANYPTGDTAPDLKSGYAIVTTHTTMRGFPTDRPLMYDKNDADDDNLYVTPLRVNEPLLVRAQSVDGKFLLCISSCMPVCWVPAADVAICENRAEWLDAWDIPAGEELVVTGYKVRTELSRVTPATSDRMLYMGTVLRRVDWADPSVLIGTRSTYNNHVCYLPVRNADGTYDKQLALIAESADVSEGFLPLTQENIANTAFKSLGEMYGWGGMLEADDCSGYVRDVYRCFGLELARNTTWQMNLPVCKYDLAGLDASHKAAAIAQMPLGTVLLWGDHEMIYLGQENGKLYVISSTGAIGNLFGEMGVAQVKGVIVNTLDMIRGNRTTWLDNLTVANVPYVPAAEKKLDLTDIAFYENSVTWPADSYDYTGKAIAPDVSISGLVVGVDYEVSFANNVEPGTATVTVAGKGSYSGTISRTFKIVDRRVPESSLEMHRLYNPYTGEHFYTASAAERNGLTAAGWVSEGRGWYAPKTSSEPVYRLYNPFAGDHHYTTSVSEVASLVKAGWNYEGIGWYSDPDKGVPLYRQYNPFAVTGAHNYTTSTAERDSLLSLGWRDEGIAWYGMK